ncbi:ABC transporter substrate-binding protein [Nocardioides acrostichi]|uniref:ABC transporter substrate-binding protein n=1 Tax=Nocardioides acrostichi TaxID=2784339 RepID=A0A930UV98_9ACTN|nr:ABC transporter substrate-binding protein [Nocardioides acrostichi]MBF4161493.1 ABC transporter substrate-binding protein [Nocardioides acrostichi]
MAAIRSRTTDPRRRVRMAIGVLAALSIGTLAACGSQLDPEEVRSANGSTAADGSVAGGGDTGGSSGSSGGSVAGSTGSASGDDGSSTSSGGTSSGGSSSSGSKASGTTPSQNEPLPAGDCAGFKNGPGITDSTITIGNSSDVSGPVPGIFEASQDATKAFVAYFNQTNPKGICGRKLVLKTYDTGTSESGDQRNYTAACNEVFAMVGSMSAFDSGGAGPAEKCGLPDIRSTAVTSARYDCDVCFGAQSTKSTEFENAVPDYVLKSYKEASQNAAMLYINAGAAAENGKTQSDAMNKRGMKFTYVQGVDISDFNYSPYVQKMKDSGVGYVQMIAQVPQFVRLVQAMQQQDYKPDVLMFDPTAYNPKYVQQAGDAAEGTTVFTNFVPFEEASSSPETSLYLNYLQQTKPGATPDFFGVFSWSAARLFAQTAAKLGGKLNRASLVQALSQVDNWTANGMHAPQHVGPKRTGDCWRFLRLEGGQWKALGGTKYTCSGTTTVG